MTSPAMTAPSRPSGGGRLTQARVARSEWIKLSSLRSSAWTMAAFVVTTAGTGLLLCDFAREHLNAGKHVGTSTAVLSIYGAYLAPLTIGVLGVLLASGEYATGQIRSTLTAVPARLPVLWAKFGVFALVTLAVSEVTLLVTFLAGQAMLAGPHAGASLADPGVLRAVTGTGLYIAVTGLFGLALGFLLRNTAAAISTLFGIMLVLPVLANVLPPAWTSHFVAYLPSNAGQAIMAVRQLPHTLAPWTGLGVFAGYIAVATGIAAVLLKARDA
jgi:ABC-type transport system involved in multi-copper enzyme maturation permease subunit